MYCLDWEDDVEDLLIYGSTNEESYSTFEMVLAPCSYLHKEDETDFVSDECLMGDKDAMVEYLG